MSNVVLSPLEIEKRGQEFYNNNLKAKLEKEYLGQFAVIDVDSEEFFLGASLDEALAKARSKYPDRIFHTIKIGSEGIFRVSGISRQNDSHEWLF